MRSFNSGQNLNIFCTFTFQKERCLVNGDGWTVGHGTQLLSLHTAAARTPALRLRAAASRGGISAVARGRKREAAPARPARRPSSTPGPTPPHHRSFRFRKERGSQAHGHGLPSQAGSLTALRLKRPSSATVDLGHQPNSSRHPTTPVGGCFECLLGAPSSCCNYTQLKS